MIIRDNGRGMSAQQCASLENGQADVNSKHHIGVRNALQRMRMYYGQNVSIHVESEIDKGTSITLNLPIQGGAA